MWNKNEKCQGWLPVIGFFDDKEDDNASGGEHGAHRAKGALLLQLNTEYFIMTSWYLQVTLWFLYTGIQKRVLWD